jgi:hypothetical protein
MSVGTLLRPFDYIYVRYSILKAEDTTLGQFVTTVRTERLVTIQ